MIRRYGFESPLPSLSIRIRWEHVFVPRGPRYSEEEAREAIAASFSWSEALRRLGMCHSGGAHLVLQKYAKLWGIPADHFDPYAAVRGSGSGHAGPWRRSWWSTPPSLATT
jgi:hypothetical protein